MNERPHLLIVDDDREIRGLLAQYLEKHEFRTTAVPDGKEMRRVMERSHVDLLVLDLMLPGEDGLSLCRERLAVLAALEAQLATTPERSLRFHSGPPWDGPAAPLG